MKQIALLLAMTTAFACAAAVPAPVPTPPAPALACTPRVPLAASVQAEPVTFDWRPLLPAAQAKLPAASSHSQPLTGTLFWPRHAGEPLPAVILLHGSGATQCDLFSAAQLLAAQGYVTLTLTQPDNHSASSETSGVEALYSALAFLGALKNSVQVQGQNVALIGHSEGAGVVSMAQGLPGFEAVRAIVALDNLRHWLTGDPGSAVRSCEKKPAGEVMPRVPALGFAKDGPCTATGDTTPNIKLSGWRWWQSHGVASVELVPAGYTHLTFTDRKGTPTQLRWQGALMAAWLNSWLKNEPKPLNVFYAEKTKKNLSRHYISAIYFNKSQNK